MRRDRVLSLLQAVATGEVDPNDALERLRWTPIEEIHAATETTAGGPDTDTSEPGTGLPEGVPYARIDHHRALRQGQPEVVLCTGKTVDQVVQICEHLSARGSGFLATRADQETRERLRERFPDAHVHELGRVVHFPADSEEGVAGGIGQTEARIDDAGAGPILVVSAGTSDLPVAEEAAVTATAFGHDVERLYDVGVAGIHRILAETKSLDEASVIIVVAGMDGALPSVVGGLVRVPVIAVPTSTGYGAAFGGLAALLGMLNSCAAGVTVVNIDNGSGAACAATRIHQLETAER